MDRRTKLALDESYHYYLDLDKTDSPPDLFRLIKCLHTVEAALNMAEGTQFKLTKQLWKRINYALFDKLITSFPGYVLVVDGDGNRVKPKTAFPESGVVEFYPEGGRRKDDVFSLEIKNLYPATQYRLGIAWKARGAMVRPADFYGPLCTEQGCFLKPVVLGQEVLNKESLDGREKAYTDWWELYWQAYCAKGKQERTILYRQMDEIEQVWGDLYY